MEDTLIVMVAMDTLIVTVVMDTLIVTAVMDTLIVTVVIVITAALSMEDQLNAGLLSQSLSGSLDASAVLFALPSFNVLAVTAEVTMEMMVSFKWEETMLLLNHITTKDTGEIRGMVVNKLPSLLIMTTMDTTKDMVDNKTMLLLLKITMEVTVVHHQLLLLITITEDMADKPQMSLLTTMVDMVVRPLKLLLTMTEDMVATTLRS